MAGVDEGIPENKKKAPIDCFVEGEFSGACLLVGGLFLSTHNDSGDQLSW